LNALVRKNIFVVVQVDQSDPVSNLVEHLSLYQGLGNSRFCFRAKHVLQSMEPEGTGTSENCAAPFMFKSALK